MQSGPSTLAIVVLMVVVRLGLFWVAAAALNYANRLISGPKVAVNLATTVATMHPCKTQPTSEYQIRSLVQLEPEQQREIWEEAVRGRWSMGAGAGCAVSRGRNGAAAVIAVANPRPSIWTIIS